MIKIKIVYFAVSYQVNARTELAIRYNDMSPLENHHCAVAFQILGNPECNIFANVDKATFMKVRSVSTTKTKGILIYLLLISM